MNKLDYDKEENVLKGSALIRNLSDKDVNTQVLWRIGDVEVCRRNIELKAAGAIIDEYELPDLVVLMYGIYGDVLPDVLDICVEVNPDRILPERENNWENNKDVQELVL